MASPTQCTWVWVNSGSWWWTGRPGMLRFMGSQRVRHDWGTELNWTHSLESGDFQVACSSCRPWIAILCQSQINPFLLEKLLAFYMFWVTKSCSNMLTEISLIYFYKTKVCAVFFLLFLDTTIHLVSQAQNFKYSYSFFIPYGQLSPVKVEHELILFSHDQYMYILLISIFCWLM